MREHLSGYSVRELHKRYLSECTACSDDILRQMRSDPRLGVRKIYSRIMRGRNQSVKERGRLDRMLAFERALWASGVARVAGVDEAGIGPLAGPVVAAAVVFPPEILLLGVDDSKRLSIRDRCRLAGEIHQRALSVGIGISEVDEIDRLNVYHAGLLAMRRAIRALSERADHILVDGRVVPGLSRPQQKLIKGDRRSFVIAAASIVAKTHRDRIMLSLDRQYPGYGFARNNGYGTAEHRAALERYGPAAPHRRSFSLIRGAFQKSSGNPENEQEPKYVEII